MAVGLLTALARRARPSVYGVIGDGGRGRALELSRDCRIVRAVSPRHASLLLVAGDLPPEMHAAARQIHDQITEPRAVVSWGTGEQDMPFSDVVHVGATDDPVPVLAQLHRDLMDGRRRSTPTLGPEQNPVEWQGVGPHGQGGEGMMGGKPFGRAMAMTGDDVRDGLQLDCVPVTLGPFLPWLPPGLRLRAELQGDVIVSLDAKVPRFRHHDIPEVFLRARSEPVRVAELEIARAKHHLAALADLLLLLGLDGLAANVLSVRAALGPDDTRRVQRLEKALRRSTALRWATRGLGVLPGERLSGMGPVARAAARTEDLRQNDPAYRGLGFTPVTRADNDAEARWQQRLAEAIQSLQLAGRAGDRRREPGAPLEAPRGPMALSAGERWRALLSETIPGMSWDAFVITLVSLDLDVATMTPTGSYEED